MIDTIEEINAIEELNIEEIEEVSGGCAGGPWDPDCVPEPCYQV